MENKRDPNSFRTKLLIIISKELEHEKKCLMKLNSKDINDINTHFSINSFEVFMENPIEFGKPNHIGYKNGFENDFQIKKQFSEKIPCFRKLLTYKKIFLVKKKKISQLKHSLGPKTQRIKKKHIKYNQKHLIKTSIKYLRLLSENLKDSRNKETNELKNNLKTERISKNQFVHNILRDNILYNNPYLIGKESYSPLIYYK